jgi:hypothetical protein
MMEYEDLLVRGSKEQESIRRLLFVSAFAAA